MHEAQDDAPLRIHALTKHYGDLAAVQGLDLEVRAGEILGFLGPNGAGKTTTLRVCAGLLTADAGEVSIAGASLAREPMQARAGVGFVPDRPYLYERLTGREFLQFVGALYDVRPDDGRIEAAITRLDLSAVADDLIETYSQGMRQKTSIATALIHEPALMLLDEPLGGLDPHAVRLFKDLLRERAAHGCGVLVSTHLLEVAERLCDRVVILDRGRKRAEGSLAELQGDSPERSLEDVFLALTRDAPETLR